jgi:hypothetical protein
MIELSGVLAVQLVEGCSRLWAGYLYIKEGNFLPDVREGSCGAATRIPDGP